MQNPQFPDYIRCSINDEFLITFKEQLEAIFYKEKPEYPTYWNYYQWLDERQGFKRALKEACILHNLYNLYEYLENIEWFDSEYLQGSLTETLYERGIIDEGNIEEAIFYPFSNEGRY